MNPSFFHSDSSTDVVNMSMNDFQRLPNQDKIQNKTNILFEPSLTSSIQPIHVPDINSDNTFLIQYVAQQRGRTGPLKWKNRQFITNESLIKFVDKPLQK